MSSTMTNNSRESIKPVSHHDEQFKFTGNASEYFKIWIVNVCLTILTLGIYSAWAKVRTTRYFYGNTHLAGSSFDYLAKPTTILKGRVFAAVIFMACLGFTSYTPVFKLALGIGLLVITPWLVVRALSFRAHNTAYRNIRFNFHGGYSRAMFVFWIIMVFINIITSSLAYPWTLNKKQQYIIANSAYGTRHFSFTSSASKYYGAVIETYIMAIFFAALATGVFSESGGFPKMIDMMADLSLRNHFFVVIVAIAFIVIFYIGTSIKTLNANITFSAISIDQLSLNSDLKVSRMLWLYMTNFIAIVCSCGLLIPWAKIRTYQYRMSTLSINGAEHLDDFVAASDTDERAIGEGIADIFDVEIGL